MTTSEMTPADIAAVTGNNNNADGWGGGWSSWIIIFLIFAMFGWGRNGFGNNGYGCGDGNNGGNPALTRGELCQDFNFQELKSAVQSNGQEAAANFRSIDNAVCTLGYNSAMLNNATQMQISNGFGTLDTSLCQLGNNFAQQTNALSRQFSDCCCDLKGNIKDVNTQSIFNTNAIQQQIQSCCCENEKIALQNRYESAQANCTTLQAIEKLGDRIIDYMSAQNAQNLRDENFALKLSASQAQQNSYLVNQLAPKCPIPAFLTCNPYTGQTYTNGYGYGNSCNCNSQCGF